jgi:hypothetical protein
MMLWIDSYVLTRSRWACVVLLLVVEQLIAVHDRPSCCCRHDEEEYIPVVYFR